MSFYDKRSIPELEIFFEIVNLPLKERIQDYFVDVMEVLAHYFPVKYSALLMINDLRKDSLVLEAIYGIEKRLHPTTCDSKTGIIGKVLESKKPMVIQNQNQEPFYEEVLKTKKLINKIYFPLLCIPIIKLDEPIGVININSLTDSTEEFSFDFQFLMVLNAILIPKFEIYQMMKCKKLPVKSRLDSYLLDEILEAKLNEFLSKVDPYVEVKGKTRLLNDIVSIVEKILIEAALKKVEYVQTEASELLGINRNTLRKKIKDLKIKIR